MQCWHMPGTGEKPSAHRIYLFGPVVFPILSRPTAFVITNIEKTTECGGMQSSTSERQ